jgi:thioredoxin reductase (NADPH)
MSSRFHAVGLSRNFFPSRAAAAEVSRNACGWQERMRLLSLAPGGAKLTARDRNRCGERSTQDQCASGQNEQLRGPLRRHERHRENQNAHQRQRPRANQGFRAGRPCSGPCSRSDAPKYEDRPQRHHASGPRRQTDPARRSQQDEQRAEQQHNKFAEQPKKIVGSRHVRVQSARHYQTSRRRVQSRVVSKWPRCRFNQPSALAAEARNDTISSWVWFAALVCSIEHLGENSVHKVIIIGSGCAGLTAAIYAARADLAPLVLDGYEPGGQLALTTMVENFPGFPDGILGPELIENSRKQAQRFGTQFQSGAVTSVDLSRRPFTVVAGKETYETESLIVAAGASARMLGIESERHLLGHGVSTCATCDGFFFRGKDIIVVGGGDTAMEEATFLTKFAKKVTLIHRRNEFRATKIMLDRARANEKIEFLTPYVIEEVHDMNSKSVEKVRLRNTDTNATSELDTSGVFVAIGHDPNTKLFKGQLDMDENGYLITHDGPKTNIEGVFAAGDVQDHHYRQAITAAGSGCMAAIEAERFLEGHKG